METESQETGAAQRPAGHLGDGDDGGGKLAEEAPRGAASPQRT